MTFSVEEHSEDLVAKIVAVTTFYTEQSLAKEYHDVESRQTLLEDVQEVSLLISDIHIQIAGELDKRAELAKSKALQTNSFSEGKLKEEFVRVERKYAVLSNLPH